MKTLRTIVTVAAIVALTASAAAFAHGGGRYHHGHSGVRFGLFLGAPAYWYYDQPRYYYPAPVVTVPSSPPVYIERGDVQAAPESQSENYWYYCTDAKAYYPYVKQCPGGWQRVVPQPPPG